MHCNAVTCVYYKCLKLPRKNEQRFSVFALLFFHSSQPLEDPFSFFTSLTRSLDADGLVPPPLFSSLHYSRLQSNSALFLLPHLNVHSRAARLSTDFLSLHWCCLLAIHYYFYYQPLLPPPTLILLVPVAGRNCFTTASRGFFECRDNEE